MKKRLYEFIFCRLMGWKITGINNLNVNKCVFMVVPHTSWHDFYLGLFTRGISGVPMHFMGKKELFRFPLGLYFTWMGGKPLDRTGNLNKVDAIAKTFDNYDELRLAIAPEGTRKLVSELKTGFYYIALKAAVPILPVSFNFGKKEVAIGAAFFPTGDYDADMKKILPFFKGVVGKIPERTFKV